MRSLGRNLALALALGAAVYLVLAAVSDFGSVAGALESFDYGLLPVILGLVALSYAGRFWRWVYYLKVLKVQVPLGTNAAIFAAGLSMTISPGKLGEVLKSVFVRQVSGAAISRTAPAVVAERITDGTGVIFWGLLGALTFSFGPGVLLVSLAVAALAVAVLRSRRLSVLAERALLRIPLLCRLAPAVGVFHASSNELLSARPLILGTTISFLSWGLEILAVYLCAVGIGVQLPFLVVVFVFAAGSLIGVGSMLPGGIGAAEASMAGMFRFYAGLSGSLAVALTFVIRLVTLWFATLVGIVGLLVVRYLLGEASLETDN